jgi:hypothetical protein
MVGAGFSRNADKSHASQKELPTWSELGDIFFEKIHGEKPGSNARYLNMLKLAEEVDATFGRVILNEILITNIPDKDYSPSELHVKLLKLNWSDVFTTNYDTLLERACEKVFSRRYDVIVNQEDLVYSKQPRIVKLHGTFPSVRPLIISESDYRRYPKQFAPFINTVQQALLENTLCLIGFSADDPNFLQWIGWIHDNLGKENAPKIYMIGLFNFSDAQKRHLEMKNIVIVDLSCFEECAGNHSKALNLFLDHLSYFQKEDKITWPKGYLRNIHYSNEKFKEVADSWEWTRNTYPNWLILPEENRELLWNFTSTPVGRIEDIITADPVVDIEYCYELNWRMEKCLCPLIDNVGPTFYSVFKKYAFLGLSQSEGISESDLNIESYAARILQEKWVDLGIAVLRSFREKGNLILWSDLFRQLSSIKDKFSAEALAKYSYEKALYSLASHDYLTLWEDLETWPHNEILPFWEAKRAGLLVEVGQSKESLRILERSLSYVRKHMNLSVESNNYLWRSLEAYIMYLHFCIGKNVKLELGSKSDQEFSKRWAELASYKCDPFSERRLFDQGLKREFVEWSNKSEEDAFDIGFKYKEYRNGENVEVLKAYSFIRYLEEIGFPLSLRHYSISSKVMVGALRRVVNYSPYLIISLISRYNDENIVKNVLGRNEVAIIETDNVDILIENHLNVFFNILPNIDLKSTAERFVARMPDILSRLCVKCSTESKLKLFKFICEVYKNGIETHKMNTLLNRLMDASSDSVKYSIIFDLLETPIEFSNDMAFPEPFHFLSELEKIPSIERIDIPEWQIVRLLEQSVGGHANRKRATFRLFKLQQFGLLKEMYQNQLRDLVWGNVDAAGYPVDIDFDRRYVLKNAGKNGDEVIKIFKEHLFSRDFVNDPPDSLSIGGKVELVRDIIWISKTLDNVNGIAWSVEELSHIIDKLINWWNKDRLLIQKFNNKDEDNEWISGARELNMRFKSIIDLIVKIIPVEKQILQELGVLNKLIRLITEMELADVPVLRAKACFVSGFYGSSNDLLVDIERAMKHKEELTLVDSFDAIFFFASYHKDNDHFSLTVKGVVELLVVPLRWDILPQKRYSASIFAEIMRYMPEIDISFALPSLVEYLGRGLESYGQQKVATVLVYVKNDVKLASAMYQWYQRSGHSIPLVLEKWKEFTLDKEQFSDVTNAWRIN